MKITSINIPATLVTFGLEEIKLSNLGRMVFLAGPNGSGKSRFLQTIETFSPRKPTKQIIENAKTKKNDFLTNIDNLKTNNKNLKQLPNPESYSRQIDNNLQTISDLENRIVKHNKNLEWSFITTDIENEEQLKTVWAVPKSVELKDYRQDAPNKTNSAIRSVSNLGVSGLQNGCLPYIKKALDTKFNATHQDTTYDAEIVQDAKESGERLEELIRVFLKTELKRDVYGEPILFNKHIADTGLSNGQKILLQLCVQIHAQKANLSNLILLLDEPENHLHPAAAIEMITAINDAAPDCQLWIATHSIPLLSYFDDATLLFVENGHVSYSGSKPEQVLQGLIGEDERIQKIKNFTSLPSIYAMNRYATQCLLPPTVVAGQDRDDQTDQIQNFVLQLQGKIDRPLRVLDYGAGKGRILQNLSITTHNIIDKIDYYAFDPFPDDKGTCCGIIKQVYGDSTNRYFSEKHKITEAHSSKYFDIVIMCNVLHEIDPEEWLGLFRKDGTLTSLLSKDGALLLVEDEEIPVGEKAHKKGFIVFDTSELRELFNIKPGDEFPWTDHRGDGRLKAHIIRKKYLEQITASNRKKSLEARKRRAIEEIEKLRENRASYKAGRKHAFWVQQLANTVLALESL